MSILSWLFGKPSPERVYAEARLQNACVDRVRCDKRQKAAISGLQAAVDRHEAVTDEVERVLENLREGEQANGAAAMGNQVGASEKKREADRP
jgi:hypothetical protein